MLINVKKKVTKNKTLWLFLCEGTGLSFSVELNNVSLLKPALKTVSLSSLLVMASLS